MSAIWPLPVEKCIFSASMLPAVSLDWWWGQYFIPTAHSSIYLQMIAKGFCSERSTAEQHYLRWMMASFEMSSKITIQGFFYAFLKRCVKFQEPVLPVQVLMLMLKNKMYQRAQAILLPKYLILLFWMKLFFPFLNKPDIKLIKANIFEENF